MEAGEAQLLFELRNIGYDGPFLDQNYASTAILAGPQSGEFQDVVIWLTEEIRVLGKLDERVGKSDDSNSFILELSAFLKELTCPYANLTSGHVSERLITLESKLLLLDYLINELMAFKMLEALKPKEKSNVITLHESPTAAALKDICITLGMGKPPNNVPPKALFERINTSLDEVIRRAGENRLSKPLFNPKQRLTGEQWAKLERLQKDLDAEYDLRRKMLLTRLDVTIQSFKWSTRIKGKEGIIAERYAEKRKILDSLEVGGRDTDVAALLAARETLAIIEKTSSASVRKNTKSKIQRHIIGRVPDRGGRAYEHKAPPLEMPSWQKERSTGGGGGGGGGGGRGGFGGGRGGRGGGGGGGGYQQQQQQQQQQQMQLNYSNKGYNQGAQNYHQGGRGGYNQGGGGNGVGGFHGGGIHNQNRGSRVQGGWSQPQQDYNHSGYGSGSSRNSYSGGDQYSNSSGGNRSNYGDHHRGGGGYSDRGGNYGGGGDRGGYGDRGGGSGYGDNRNNYDNEYNNRGGGRGGGGRSNYNRGGGGGRR